MAKFYWHEFIPSFSGVVLVTLIALVIIAFVTGYRSVKVRPRRVGGAKADPEAPKFKSRKVAQVRDNFKRSLMRRKDIADSAIVFRSATMDALWALVAGVVFTTVFVNEHWYGLVQFFINNLASNEGAAWGDIEAFIVVAVLGGAVSCVFYVISEYAQWLHATKMTERYLYQLNVRPIIKEKPHIIFIAKVLIWAIRKSIEEEAEKKAQERRNEISAEISEPNNCKVIEFDRRAI